MPKKLERLLFAQGGKCFFCHQPLQRGQASVEHLVAVANKGSNGEHNCVACCKSLNQLFGSMSLKDKLKAILERRGEFRCPSEGANASAKEPSAPPDLKAQVRIVIFNLRNRSTGLPRTVQRLSSAINALFQNSLSNEQITAMIGKMQRQRYITLNGTKVSYSLPASEPGM